MRVRPQQWTHHHTRRVLHVSFLACWLVIVGALVVSQITFWLPATADTVMQSGTVNLTAQVGMVNPTPAEPLPNNGGSSGVLANIPPRPSVPPQKIGYNPLVSIVPVAPNVTRRPNARDADVLEWVFPTQYVAFSGETNIPNGVVFITIATDRGATIVRSSTVTDATGAWRWRSFDPLPEGQFVVTVLLSDPASADGFTGSALPFVVDLPAGEVPVVPPAVVGNRFSRVQANLFDVFVQVPQRYQTYIPGQPVTAQVKLLNFGTQAQPADVTVQYVVSDAQYRVILTTEETVSAGPQLALLKTFYTDKTLPAGLYTVTVRVPSATVTASATDTFELVPAPAPVVAATAWLQTASFEKVLVFGCLVLILILFLSLVLFEYKNIRLLSAVMRAEGHH